MLTQINLVRQSHWLQGSALGTIQMLLRIAASLGMVYALSTAEAVHLPATIATQFARLIIAWVCLLVVIRPPTACISLRHKLLPIRPSARVMGALWGWRSIEALPCLALSAYFRTWWPAAVAILALSLTGLLHSFYDDYLRRLPPVAGALASPLMFGAVLSAIPGEVPPHLLPLATVLTLFGLYLGFQHQDLRFLLTVSGLTARLYRHLALRATALGMLGSAVGMLLCGYSYVECVAATAALGGTSCIWWRVSCGKTPPRTYLSWLGIQVILLSFLVTVVHKAVATWPLTAGLQSLWVAAGMIGFCAVSCAAALARQLPDARFAAWLRT